MPPKGYSAKKQIAQLTKDLELARGTIQDKTARIEDLGKKLASKIEEIEELGKSLDGVRATTKENVELKKALASLQVAYDHEKGNRADMEREYRDKIKEISERATAYQLDRFATNKRYGKICEQNITLRAALKAVL